MRKGSKVARATMSVRWVAQAVRNGEYLKTNERRALANYLDELAKSMESGYTPDINRTSDIFNSIW